MSKDYYEILGVSKDSSKEDIKKAYKKLAKKYHPDISKEDNAEEKFKEINEAAGVLLDDQKKQQYDTYGSAGGPQGFGDFSGGFGGGFNPSDFGINLDDIFEQFGFRTGGSGFGRQSNSQRDTRVYTEVEISLEDVYFGSEEELKIEKDVKCETCSGKGAKNTSDIKTCSTCDGTGIVTEVQRSFLGAIRTQRPCHDCSGKGKTITNPCSDCQGKGIQNKKDTMKLKIPKGVESGVTLRVQGKGSYDSKDNSYGDLFVKVYVKNSKEYDVDGADLYRGLDVNFVQAILGDEIEIKHFKKTLSLKIPQGTQPGTVLRLKGKGLPFFNHDSYADLYIKVNVLIPEKTTKEQKEILIDYAKTLKDKSLMGRLKGFFK